MQKIYYILGVVGWIWLVVAALLLALALWRKKRQEARRGLDVKPADEARR